MSHELTSCHQTPSHEEPTTSQAPSTIPNQGFWEIFQIQTIATSLWPWAWNLAIWVQCFLSCKVREIVLTSKEIAQAQHTRYNTEVPLLFPHRQEGKQIVVCGHNGCSIPTALHLPGLLKCCFHPKSHPSLPSAFVSSAVKGATVDRFFPNGCSAVKHKVLDHS